ncbi:MAG TPA: tRNA (adenosine(37)-N6)-threonylcarbamoyltransferase complex dimerization subunit type 1 TsaB [Telmatospirillum sp.]|nr:tRNA (adenosine(37)-N6)-threonylcarbamoyltransferase complex dimerization subunit type 1 TsaB [Telmatospirillum sp.]
MTILAFDCSTQNCSAAILRQGQVLSWHTKAMSRGQSEALMPMIEATLGDAGVVWQDLSLIGVTVGPGTFTGIRIGLAAARGLGLAAHLPIAGIGTCDALAHAIPLEERQGRTVIVAVDSKRADLFVQVFTSDLVPLGPPAGMPASEAVRLCAGPLLLAGDAAEQLMAFRPDARISEGTRFPDARVIARLSAERYAGGLALPPEPIYLRPPDVTMPQTPGPGSE